MCDGGNIKTCVFNVGCGVSCELSPSVHTPCSICHYIQSQQHSALEAQASAPCVFAVLNPYHR